MIDVDDNYDPDGSSDEYMVAQPQVIRQHRELMEEVQQIRESVDSIVSVNNDMKVPIALHRVLVFHPPVSL